MQHQRRIVAEPPRRVVVLGSPGAGKRRLAAMIGERFALPVVSLDREMAEARRLARAVGASGPDDAWRTRVAELAAQDQWVMEGNSPDTFDLRIPRADWLIFLNVPMSVCFMRVLRRRLRARRAQGRAGGTLGHLQAGDPGTSADRSTWSRLREVWAFPTDVAPRIAGLVERERRNRTIFLLHSARDITQFLARLNGADKPDQGLPSGRRSL